MAGKALLKQYRDLQIEIKELENRIKKLENCTYEVEHDVVRGSDNVFPYTEKTFHIEGYNIQDIDKRNKRLNQLEKLLIKRKDKCEDMKLQIEEFINTIPDSRTRRVFQYRYIDNLNWLEIAHRIGKYDESYPRKVIHDKYLEG